MLLSPSSSASFVPPLLQSVRPRPFSNNCRAASQQKQRRAPPAKKRPPRRREPDKKAERPLVEVLPSPKVGGARQSRSLPPPPLPKPPAGFVIDNFGRVLIASSKRVATIVDSDNVPLECIIRRVFQSSRGDECMLLCPVDMPIYLLKTTNFDGWSAVSQEERDTLIPAVAYALAKIHMHLVISGFVHTARGGFCYSEEDILDFHTDTGEDLDGTPAEGIEITLFHQDGAHYMIYTPSDPLLFVATKNQDGTLQIADDDILEDPAIVAAIDEETEFNALVEEEEAVLESLLGEV